MNRKELSVHCPYAASGINFLIFIFFAAGLLLADYLSIEMEFAAISRRSFVLILSVFPLLAFIASSSIFSFMLQPLLSFGLGFLCFILSSDMLEGYLRTGAPDLKLLVFTLIFYPAFFLISVQGMETSRILINSLCRSTRSQKTAYNIKYIPMILALGLSSLAAFIITG